MYLTGPLHAHTRDETVVQEVLLFYASHQGYGIQEEWLCCFDDSD